MVVPSNKGQPSLNDNLKAVKDADIAPRGIIKDFYTARDTGNGGSHASADVTIAQAQASMLATYRLAFWFIHDHKGYCDDIPASELPETPVNTRQPYIVSTALSSVYSTGRTISMRERVPPKRLDRATAVGWVVLCASLLFLTWAWQVRRDRERSAPEIGQDTGTQSATPRNKRNARGARRVAPIDAFRSALYAGAGKGATGIVPLWHNQLDRDGTQALMRNLPSLNTSAIRAEAMQRQGFATGLYDGDTGLLREALSVTGLRSLVVMDVTAQCQNKSSLDPDLLSCDLTARARKFDRHGELGGSVLARGTGAGFNQADALEQAAQRASADLIALARR